MKPKRITALAAILAMLVSTAPSYAEESDSVISESGAAEEAVQSVDMTQDTDESEQEAAESVQDTDVILQDADEAGQESTEPTQEDEVTDSGEYFWIEKLNRGLAVVPVSGGMYLSWRLQPDEDNRFGTAAENVEFDIYRDGEKIATESGTTNYIDAGGSVNSVYTIAPAGEEPDGDALVLTNGYLTIPLEKPADETIYDNSGTETGTYSFAPADCSTGDLDGDGEYEIVVKWTSNEKDVGNAGYSGTVRFGAYKLDGTKMWEQDINLGRNVFSSAHTAQFLVYDFDGDGKAEMTCQTSLGSTDGKGNYVSKAADPSTNSVIYGLTDDENASADYRAANNGRVTTGQEFLTVFDGETGEAIDTITYPTARYNLKCWGKDDGGNRCNRFLATVAYLDGEKPYAVYWRGYYDYGSGRTGIAGVSFNGERLSVDYQFDTLKGQPGYHSELEDYSGQGNHSMVAADVDDDGKDEFISGALCMEVNDNNELVPKWCSWREHGDAHHIGDYDPTNPGLEYFSVHEHNGESHGKTLDYGMTVYSATSGEELFHAGNTKDTGRGLMANVGAGGYYQISGGSGAGSYISNGGTDFESVNFSIGTNFRVFWDGDLYDEGLDGTSVTSWNGSKMAQIFNADGCTKVNGSKSNPSLSADLFGDWREELVYPTTDGTALRVYMTTEQTSYKMKSLVYDRMYREGVAAEQTCYNQPPHISYYLSDDLFYGTLTGIELDETNLKTTYYAGEELDKSGLKVIGKYSDQPDKEVTAYSVSGYDPLVTGDQVITVKYMDYEQMFTVNVSGETGITAQTTKDTYNVNEDFDKTTLSVVLNYTDGTQKEITSYKLKGYDSMKAGEQTLNISYTGAQGSYDTTITVTVKTGLITRDGKITGYDDDEAAKAYAKSEGTQITASILEASDSAIKVYAAKYTDTGALEKAEIFDVDTVGESTFTASFEPDKVFLWSDMEPVNQRQGGRTEVTIPSSVVTSDGDSDITEITDGIFVGSAVTKVYIYDDDIILTGDNIFNEGTTIVCTEGSAAQEYANAHGLATEIVQTGDKVTFDEDFYSNYAGKNMLMQGTSDAALADEYVTYHTKGTSNAPWYAANTYGFKIIADDGNNYLYVNSGIYDDMNKFNQIYMSINNAKTVSEKQTLSFDIMFPSGGNAPYLEIQNAAGTVIDTISGLTANTWYTYELSYDGDSYTRTVYKDGAEESTSALSVTPTGTIVSTLAFKQGYSNGNSAQSGLIYIDNITIK